MKMISLLRGINVSGQKKVNMTDLKALYQKMGLIDVETYIQTGNIIYIAPGLNQSDLIEQQEIAIEKKYHFHVPVDIRSHREIKKIVKDLPFTDVNVDDNLTKILVTFLGDVPDKKACDQLLSTVKAPEKLIISGLKIYIYCPNGYGKSKLTNNYIEKKLKVTATTRNWKTVLKLDELSM